MIFYIRQADIRYLLLSVVCVVFYVLGESVVIKYLLAATNVPVSFSHCCLFSFIGFFYSCITPSASGGQPMQIAAMREDRIPVAVSTVILAIVTITYKLVLVLIGVVVLTVRPVALMYYLSDVLWLMYLGVALNIICVAALLLLVLNPNLAQFIAGKITTFLCWIHLVKEPQKLRERLDHTLEQYRGTASFFQSHKLVVLWSFLITIAQRTILFFVTWLVYRAFHLSGTSVFVIITLQAMISVAVDMLPLPGGMGISEKLFSTIFLPIFGELRITAGMVLSRGISYYTQLLISGVMTVAATIILKREES